MMDLLPLPKHDTWLNRLQSSGYRLTGSRRAIVEIIVNSDRILNPTQIYDMSRQRFPSIGLVTIYRTLAKLEELNLIQRVHQPGNCHSYIAAVSGHQHLLVCQNCGRTDYFDGDNLDNLMIQVENNSGFCIREHWLQFFGLCQSCASIQIDKPSTINPVFVGARQEE
jgi:Fur family ferric uptake transcriptional regulator